MREWWRYLCAGGFNTLATYTIYLFLLRTLDYKVSYIVAFFLGIAISFVLLRHLVFMRKGRPFSLLWLAASQMLQLFLGLAVVHAWVAWLNGAQWLAPLASLAVCVPLMFALQRWIFTPNVSSK